MRNGFRPGDHACGELDLLQTRQEPNDLTNRRHQTTPQAQLEQREATTHVQLLQQRARRRLVARQLSRWRCAARGKGLQTFNFDFMTTQHGGVDKGALTAQVFLYHTSPACVDIVLTHAARGQPAFRHYRPTVDIQITGHIRPFGLDRPRLI